MAAKNDKPSPAYIQSVLRYDEKTGIFFWKKAVGNASIGKKAGSVKYNGYVYIFINHCACLAHRVAFVIKTGNWPECEVDHISGDPSDNSWKNLRPATHQQNSCNLTKRTRNSSGFKGIYASKNRWKAAIKYNRKRYFLGSFCTKEEAYSAYCEAAKKLHGEFASF